MTAADDDLRACKAALRVTARSARRSISEVARDEAARAALAHLCTEVPVPPGACIAGFWPLAEEFDTRPLLQALHAGGHPCALPVVVGRGKPLIFRFWQPGMQLEAGSFRVLAPPETAPARRPDVLLVPLLAFDAAGYRLGYGGGYYDRTLALLRSDGGPPPLAVGLAFAAQEVAEVPRGLADQPLDWMVNEAGARRFGPSPKS